MNPAAVTDKERHIPMFQARAELIRQRVGQLTEAYQSQHAGARIPPIDIRFDLEGRAAGMAGLVGTTYFMRFNRHMMVNDSWNNLITDTVPHELAHIICMAAGTDHGHGAAWRRTCQQLGGSGRRCHEEAVIYARGGTYQYTTSTGETVNLSEAKHRRIQQGQRYVGKQGLGEIDYTCSYTKIGEAASTKPYTKAVQELVPKNLLPTATAPSPQPTKAALVRARIAQAKIRGENPQTVMQWARDCLNMTAALAQTYVKNNWHRA